MPWSRKSTPEIAIAPLPATARARPQCEAVMFIEFCPWLCGSVAGSLRSMLKEDQEMRTNNGGVVFDGHWTEKCLARGDSLLSALCSPDCKWLPGLENSNPKAAHL
ncbi:uncharacterized protein J3D65DRAFT_604008 [Phyllosticta citribraziliensis]|uniref:Uncharacterized protein n=1 Tax=Phyllosticta citribraziliensis TaxID=989973 RepID=A0ABR1LP23_9PEZI